MRLAQRCRRLLLGLFAVTLLGCAGPRVFQEKEVIKPVASYSDPVMRDMAQMLYPGFLNIREEFRQQFAQGRLQLTERSLQVVELGSKSGMPGGYYVAVKAELAPDFTETTSFLSQAQHIAEEYLHNVLVSLSRDWNSVFSPPVTGVRVTFLWEEHRRSAGNRLTFLLKNMDIQTYLNARMTLQKLVDQNWVEGEQENRSLGRIELNGLGVEPL